MQLTSNLAKVVLSDGDTMKLFLIKAWEGPVAGGFDRRITDAVTLRWYCHNQSSRNNSYRTSITLRSYSTVWSTLKFNWKGKIRMITINMKINKKKIWTVISQIKGTIKGFLTFFIYIFLPITIKIRIV